MTVPRVLVCAALAALAASCGKEPPPRVAPPPPKVTVALPVERSYEEYEDFNGWTAAYESVEIRSRVRGHIEKVHFRDGDIVAKGALLFSLDKRPFEAAVASAEGQLKVYAAQRVAAEKEFVRLKELLAKGGSSQSQVEKAEADAGALAANIEAQRAEIARLKLEVEYSTIAAPIAGRTGLARLTEGNLVNAGGSDPLLTTIVAVDPMSVYFTVPERTLLRVRERNRSKDPGSTGQAVEDKKIPFKFGLETDDGHPREGILDFGDSVVDPETGTITLRGRAKNADGYLLPGVRARVRVVVGDAEKVLLVPEEALLADMDRRYVLVVGPDSKVLRKDIRPGRLLDDGMRIVLPAAKEGEGVGPSDRVIVQGHQRARIHYPVEPLDAGGKPAGGK